MNNVAYWDTDTHLNSSVASNSQQHTVGALKPRNCDLDLSPINKINASLAINQNNNIFQYTYTLHWPSIKIIISANHERNR